MAKVGATPSGGLCRITLIDEDKEGRDLLVPCEDGFSHIELENGAETDVIAGANVLLQAVLTQAK